MATIGEFYRSADWKTEKHVPVIECPEAVPAGQLFEIKVSVGQEVAHPNTTEHHIRWIRLYFVPEGEKTPCEVGSFEFAAHGESAKGADTSTLYTHHSVSCWFKTQKAGTILATSYCNIHGLWENARKVKLA